MMGRYWVWFVSLLISHSFYAQSYVAEYFQQQVNYTITVTLNDSAHVLRGFETIEYINHSPDTLKFIYFHLWPNAYKNNNTCLAKQFLQLGEKDFYFSKPEERGFIDSLNFKVNDKLAKFIINKDTIDIGILYLNEPLLPQQSIIIKTPFYVKIPSAKFSRLGHSGHAYYITQWYPKPAVYDWEKWHPIPYLHNGEFYSEFGNFDVSITLPKNYVVASTGNRMSSDDEEFIRQKIIATKKILERKTDTVLTNTFPASDKEYKTVRFVESNVHDFAWFADKRFLVLKDEITLFDSKKKVNTYLYFTPRNLPLWKNALEYINEATLFYSYYVGDYPYNNVSAVDGSTAAGGGMEYPTITLINQSNTPKELEETIVHEVGHNWFYGILASNERDYPAMDEGINSFYEMRYLNKKYPDLKLIEVLGLNPEKKLLGVQKISQRKYYEYAYLILATHNADLPILEKSTEYTELNYGGIVYSKPVVVMNYLKNFIGEDLFDEAMAFYFKTFKFKHPQPKDFSMLLNYFEGGNFMPLLKDISYTNKKIDYKISRIKKHDSIYELTIKNKGQMTVPVVIQAIKNNRIVAEIWKNNIHRKETFSFPPTDADYFRIDYNEIMPELNRRNNTIKTHGWFKKAEPLQLNLLWRVDDPYKTQLHYFPITGWNFNDGNMLGMALYNYNIFPKKIEGFIAPMYSFKSRSLVWSGDVYMNIFPERLLKIIQLGMASKSYSYWYSENTYTGEKNFEQYVKVEPYINFEFKQKKPIQHRRHLINLRSVLLTNKYLTTPVWPSNNSYFSWINEYTYTFEVKTSITPYRFQIQLQHNDLFAKIFFNYSGKIFVSQKKYFEYNLFSGAFLYGSNLNKSPYAFRPSGYSNTQDYMFDNYYTGRFQGDNFYRQQFFEKEGGLKVWTALGYNTHQMSSLSLYTPSFKGFRLFTDMVYTGDKFYRTSSASYTQVLYDAGIQFSIANIVNVYFPVLMSSVLKDNLQLNGFDQWYNRIRYSIHIHRINPRFEATKFIE